MIDEDQSEHRHINPWIIAIAVMLSTFMEVLDTTVVNVSLPHIAGNLSATPDEATWALTSYLVANAIILPITGWLGNYFGRKRLLMLSVTLFTTASFLCGLAPSLPALIFFRILQGASGGCLQPISQAVLLEAFKPEDRGKAMGFWGLGIVVAPMLGPVLGGWLTDSYSWRWVFYINVPIGIASLIMTRAFIFDPPYIRRGTARVDYWGIGMLAVGVGALQLVLDKGQEKDWFSSHWIAALTILALTALAAFVIYELRAKSPVVNLRVLKNRTFASGVFLMTALGFVLYGSLVLLPLLLQTLLGYPALQAGFAMAPRGLGSFIAMPVVGIIIARFDARKLLALGITVCALTLWQLSRLSLVAGYWDIFWPQFIQGLSLAFLFVPLTTATMDPIPKEQMGNATSIFNLMRNLGGSMGIAGSATMSERWRQGDTNVLGANFNPYDYGSQEMMHRLQQGFMAQGSDPATALHRAYAATFGLVQRQAAMLAFNKVFLVLSALFLVMVPFLFLMGRPGSGKPVIVH
ncbi:MAG TPA: DHA2 family efflux MFS transporter permease subunit [Terriglobia bacterium]|nr:DHA2 family efflux MFS transporter permease subunit [Terriglobia bacterium]